MSNEEMMMATIHRIDKRVERIERVLLGDEAMTSPALGLVADPCFN
jgi:hypothetical protein